MNHLRCVVVKNMLIKLNEFTSEFLKESLDEISPIHCVSTSLEAVLIAFDKEFSLCANYPKGHGELFLTWLRTKYPNELFFMLSALMEADRILLSWHVCQFTGTENCASSS